MKTQALICGLSCMGRLAQNEARYVVQLGQSNLLEIVMGLTSMDCWVKHVNEEIHFIQSVRCVCKRERRGGDVSPLLLDEERL